MSDMEKPDTSRTPKFSIMQFEQILRGQGVYEALCCVNQLSAHRFTALYAFDGPLLKNICLVDKQNETIRKTDTVRVRDSYCMYVRTIRKTFIVPNALTDKRVQDHPQRAIIQSYCGIPLMHPKKHMIGSVCHFDFEPVPCPDQDVLCLEAIGPVLSAWLEQNLEQSKADGKSADGRFHDEQ
jgi:hypothetical protein